MPFSSNPLLAPVFQSPVGDGRDHRPPVVSIKRAEDAVESGVRLHHNQAREGYILQPEVEGLGVAPVELQSAPLASGGSVARHTRLAEGDVFLPITLVSPVPSALPSMFDALVEIARPGQRDEDGLPLQFEVVVYDPYGQETRSRRLVFESGLGDPVREGYHKWKTSITGRFVDPFWYGQVRELRRVLGSVDKKFITAKQGPPDPDAPPSVTYEWEGEPHASPSVKRENGVVVARNLATNSSFEANATDGWIFGSQVNRLGRTAVTNRVAAGEYSTILSWNEGASQIQTIAQTEVAAQPGQWVAISAWVTGSSSVNPTYVAGIISERNAGSVNHLEHHYLGDYENSGQNEMTRFVYAVQVNNPDVAVVRAGLRFSDAPGSSFSNAPASYGYLDGVHVAVADSEQAALDQVAEYFDGDTPDVLGKQIGGYEFPFFPVRIGGSVVQGEYELQVEGDAPAYWSGVITPPGEDLLIQNAKGERIFVQGRVDEPILIQTRPQEQDITLADGTPIWDRIDPGDDDFFPLHPGRNTVHVSMVGATQQSEILIRYREAFFHSLGGGR